MVPAAHPAEFRYWPPPGQTPPPSTAATPTCTRTSTPHSAVTTPTVCDEWEGNTKANSFIALAKLTSGRYDNIHQFRALKNTAAGVPTPTKKQNMNNFETNAHEMIPKLWVGTRASACDSRKELHHHNIHTIIQPASSLQDLTWTPVFEGEFEYHCWPLRDVADYPIVWSFPSLMQAIQTTLEAGDAVLIAGFPRDLETTLVLAYFMYDQGLEFDQGQIYLKTIHPGLTFNEKKFEKQVRQWCGSGYKVDEHHQELSRLPLMRRCVSGEIKTKWAKSKK